MRFTNNQRNQLIGAVAVLTALVVFLQYRIDPLRRDPAIEPPKAARLFKGVGTNGAILPFEYMLGAFSGFRQVIAGMLWVRTDTFFHEGNYDGILPLIRVITWLDPNWLDVYATGAWHLMYNFTDTDQRSDRRYLPAGMALLNEGIDNNPETYEVYAEAGWNNFDKIKNYDEAIRYYTSASEQKDVDITRANHVLAHSYEKAGRIDEAIAQWKKIRDLHKAVLDDPKATADAKSRAKPGYENALKEINIDEIRVAARAHDVNPPLDPQFEVTVTRTKPKVIEVKGSWNLIGSKLFDDKKGIVLQGPVDGARVEVRLQDSDYKMPSPKEFTFDLDNNVTVMQDSLSTRGGKLIRKGSLFIRANKNGSYVSTEAEHAAIYAYAADDAKKDKDKGIAEPQGIPLDKALASGIQLSALGQTQFMMVGNKPFTKPDKMIPVAQLKQDKVVIDDLTKKGYEIATSDYQRNGSFSREIDMSKDPGMYGFAKQKFDLILTVNPRIAPPMVQDRLGYSGEGWKGKYIVTDTSNPKNPPLHLLRLVIPISREDILGTGKKLLFNSDKDDPQGKLAAVPGK